MCNKNFWFKVIIIFTWLYTSIFWLSILKEHLFKYSYPGTLKYKIDQTIKGIIRKLNYDSRKYEACDDSE